MPFLGTLCFRGSIPALYTLLSPSEHDRTAHLFFFSARDNRHALCASFCHGLDHIYREESFFTKGVKIVGCSGELRSVSSALVRTGLYNKYNGIFDAQMTSRISVESRVKLH